MSVVRDLCLATVSGQGIDGYRDGARAPEARSLMADGAAP